MILFEIILKEFSRIVLSALAEIRRREIGFYASLLETNNVRHSAIPGITNSIKASNRLHDIFHKPFYAGWVVSDRFNIKIGEVRGQREPVVNTGQFERGLEILKKNDYNKSRSKRKSYLLRNLLWVQAGAEKYKMFRSTPSGRSQSYSYYITHTLIDGQKLRIPIEVVDEQIPNWLNGVAVNPENIPGIRAIYQSQIRQFTYEDKAETLQQLHRKLASLKEEEARLGRLLISGKISETLMTNYD